MQTERILLLCAALIASACGGGDPNEVSAFTPYINTEFGFRVDYPSNWQSVEDPAFLVGERPDKLHAVMFLRDQAAGVLFTVFIQQLDTEQSLAVYAEEQIASIRSNAGDAVYSDLAPAQLGGLDALETHTRVEQSGQALTQRVLLTVHDGRGYGVSLAAPEGSPLIATLDDMLETFILLP